MSPHQTCGRAGRAASYAAGAAASGCPCPWLPLPPAEKEEEEEEEEAAGEAWAEEITVAGQGVVEGLEALCRRRLG